MRIFADVDLCFLIYIVPIELYKKLLLSSDIFFWRACNSTRTTNPKASSKTLKKCWMISGWAMMLPISKPRRRILLCSYSTVLIT